MKKYTLFAPLLLLLLGACGTDKATNQDKLEEEIFALEGTLTKQMDNPTIDTATAVTLIERVDEYAERFPQDSITPYFLYRTSDVARGIGQPEKAIAMHNILIREHRDFPKLPETMFFRAFTADNDLQDKEKAISYYEAFIRAYPDHPLKKDAKMLYDVLKSGKTPDQMIKEFKAQQEKSGE
jgi:tetratricopeptide (TPR) repeat protein